MDNIATYEPQIIAFCCLHCAYAAADLAGTSRIAYPPSIKIVSLSCTGRTDMGHILKTLEDGADGVLVVGCLEGGCHFQTGNLYARQRVEHVAELLGQIGMESERVRMVNVSAGQGARFAELANEFAGTIKALGPTGLKKKPAAREIPLPSPAEDELTLLLADQKPADKGAI
jgi:coenzyme F420-reducing hydrogenase delta subunit